jgi:dipeptidyl-peptidase-4
MKQALIRYSLTFTFFLSALIVQGQSPLTIAESVTAGNGAFIAEDISGLQWIPGTETYSYLDGEGKESRMMMGSVSTKNSKTLFTFQEIEKTLVECGHSGQSLPRYNWLDSKTIQFSLQGKYLRYDVKKKRTAGQLAYLASMANATPSPDYKRIVGTIGNDLFLSTEENDSIAIAINEDEDIISGQAVSRYEFGISGGIFWSPDSKMVAYYQCDASAVTDYELLDYSTTPASRATIKYPMAGQGSEIVKVRVYDIASSKQVTLDTQSKEGDYLTSVTWSLDASTVYVGHLDRAQDNYRLVSYNANTGKKIDDILSESDARYFEPERGPYFLEGSTKSEFLWFSERDGFNHVYLYEGNGKLVRQLTSGERVMQDVLAYIPSNRTLFIQGTDSPIETVAYMLNVDEPSIQRITSETGSHQVSVTSNGKYIIDRYRSLTVPRDIKIKQSRGTAIKTLLSAGNPLASKAIGETSIYAIPGEDGVPLYCRMIKPSQFDESKKYPVLVYVYNGPHVQLVRDTWGGGSSMWMYALAEKGYIVYTIDGRGSMNRGRDFEQAVHGRAGVQETKDQMTGVEHLKSLPYVDANRMAIHGWSYGGFMTLNLMLREPGTFKVGVAGGAVTDWKFYEVMYTERYMETPERNAEGFEASQLLSRAGQLEGKLLMIHGTSDDVVVLQHFMTMVDAFIKAEEQIDVFLYPGHAHNVRGKDRIHLITKLVDYLELHL